jgi:hypothetical protein
LWAKVLFRGKEITAINLAVPIEFLSIAELCLARAAKHAEALTSHVIGALREQYRAGGNTKKITPVHGEQSYIGPLLPRVISRDAIM